MRGKRERYAEYEAALSRLHAQHVEQGLSRLFEAAMLEQLERIAAALGGQTSAERDALLRGLQLLAEAASDIVSEEPHLPAFRELRDRLATAEKLLERRM
jgi:hypothetical protein